MKIRFSKTLCIGLILILFLSIGLASATDDTAINDDVIGESSVSDGPSVNEDKDSNSILDDESPDIDQYLEESDVNSQESLGNGGDTSQNLNYYIANDAFGELCVYWEDGTTSKHIRNGSDIIVLSYKFEYIQEAIDHANENDTVKLMASSVGNGSQIIVNKSVTIENYYSNVVLDARGKSRIFCVLADNVIIRNLTLVNGFQNSSTWENMVIVIRNSGDSDEPDVPVKRSDDSNLQGNGGAIKWVGNNGSLIKCILTDNALLTDLKENGSAISWLGENGRIINSYFNFNHANHAIPLSCNDEVGNVIDRPVHGVYHGDLDGMVFFADVTFNSKPVFDLKNVSTYYNEGAKVSFYLKDDWVKFFNETVTITIWQYDYLCSYSYSILHSSFNVTSDSNGLVRFNLPADLSVGKYKFKVTYNDGDLKASSSAIIKVNKIPAKVSLANTNVAYASAKKLTLKLLDSRTGKALSNAVVNLKVYTGKKYKSYRLTTDKKGVVKVDLSKLSVGKHKIVLTGDKTINLSKTSSVKVSKAKTIVKLSKTSFKFKKSDKLKIKVTDKNTKKALKNIKIRVKVYIGSKFKTYNLKTNKKGIIQINTKNLKKGIHKISVGTGSKYYAVSKNTSIKIK